MIGFGWGLSTPSPRSCAYVWMKFMTILLQELTKSRVNELHIYLKTGKRNTVANKFLKKHT